MTLRLLICKDLFTESEIGDIIEIYGFHTLKCVLKNKKIRLMWIEMWQHSDIQQRHGV